VGKNKIRKWMEMESYRHVIQPEFSDVFKKDHALKGKWSSEFFCNSNPVVLELGCGKGEYTLNLAQIYPGKNFIGIDIKGSRIWSGAKTAIEIGLNNVAFIRTRIEFIESFFGTEEVDEIWLIFPDPQLKKRRNKKRLTSPRFLNAYREFLKFENVIHLKTDSKELYHYTKNLLEFNQLIILQSIDDLYATSLSNKTLSFKTYYEQEFLKQDKKITYLKFSLSNNKEIIDIGYDKR
jgi:tRNA (guanine-N7-)-methyltransferase